MDTCGIVWNSGENITDASGCIKPHAHNDAHIFKAEDGRFIEWEDDYNCDCGCWDEFTDDPCKVYREIDDPRIKQPTTNPLPL